MRTQAIVGVVGLHAILACVLPAQSVSGATPSPVLPRARVAAGVRVLEHDAGAIAKAGAFTLSATPLGTAGETPRNAATELVFPPVAHYVQFLSDGRLIVYAPRANSLLVFARDGSWQRQMGRSGKGPNEFLTVTGLARIRGDTLVLSDRSNLKLSWISADKGVLSEKPRGAQGHLPGERVIGAINGETILTSAGVWRNGVRDSVSRPAAIVAAYSRTGEVREILKLPDLETVTRMASFGGHTELDSRPSMFNKSASVAVWNGKLVTGLANQFALDVRTADGRIESRVVVNTARRAVTKAMRDGDIARELGVLNGASEPGSSPNMKEQERLIRGRPAPDSLPAYQQFFVSPNNTLWVIDYIAPGDAGWTATAFNTAGAIVGRLRANANTLPAAFGNDCVAVFRENKDGEHTIVLYGIVPAKGR